MAMCVIAVVGDAPCQCLTPGGNQTTSPGWTSSTGPPSRCTQPLPAVMMRVWPSGWVCQAVLAPGSKVTVLPAARAGAFAWNSGSMRTVPLNHSDGPLVEGCEPTRAISIFSSCVVFEGVACARRVAKYANTEPARATNDRREKGLVGISTASP